MYLEHQHTSLSKLLLLAATAAAVACSAEVGDPQGTEAEQEPGQVEQEIKNGSTSGFHPLIEEATVRIRTPRNRTCTGVVMSPYAVLTDRHCITTNGSATGPLGAANTIGVLRDSGREHTPNVRLANPDVTLDSALLLFDQPQTQLARWNRAQYPPVFSQFHTPQLPNSPLLQTIQVDGFGGDPESNCNDALNVGIERWGTSTLEGYANSGREIVLRGNQLPIAGDSGSGYWWDAWGAYPIPYLVGLHRTGDCVGNVRIRARGTAAATIANWVYAEINRHMRNIGVSNAVIQGNTLASQGYAWAPYGATNCDQMSWTVESGTWLREATNCGTAAAGAVFVHDRTTLTNGGVFTVVWSGDDDDVMGVAFRIQQKDMYYAVEADEQHQSVSIRKVRYNSSTTLGSWSVAVEHGGATAREVGAWASNDRLYAYYSGRWYGPVIDSDYPNGGVGLYDRYTRNAYFTNFRVQY
jgi:hypothetical protein